MFDIPARTYAAFQRIFQLGSESLRGIQREVVPTQELSRILMAGRARHVAYTLEDLLPAGTKTIDVQWNDASDWTEIQVNGVITTSDDDLPEVTDDRIVIMTGLQITGTQAQYTTADSRRHFPRSAGSHLTLIQEYGAITTGHAGPIPLGPNVLPQYLARGEDTMRLNEVMSGVATNWFWAFQMIAAEPGILSSYQGV